jgi:hypothetical protein
VQLILVLFLYDLPKVTAKFHIPFKKETLFSLSNRWMHCAVKNMETAQVLSQFLLKKGKNSAKTLL